MIKSKEELIADVEHFEDSLKQAGTAAQDGPSVSIAYADKCLLVYRSFPKSEEAPEYLDKAHIILSGAGSHRLAVQYADTLINNYPDYKNRPMVLQSLASAYDIFIVPRNKELVEKYYTLLLKENPNLPKEEREMIQNRLDHIDLTFEEMITQPQKK
jgi:tetratricopeptide (TPR) repeat protein